MKEEHVRHITGKIIAAYYTVYNILGYGFLEKVYEQAMLIELRHLGLNCQKQQKITVEYRELQIGTYFADLVVEGVVIVELKAAETLCVEHEAQLLHYLQASAIEYGLLLNFGKYPEFKRKIWTNSYHKK